MKFYFEGAFYDPEINPEIPEGALELTDEEHRALLEAQSSGKVIAPDESGAPVAADPPPPTPEETAKQQAQELYATLQRRAVMQAVPFEDDATAYTLAPVCPDWKADRHYEAGEIVNHEGIPYRVILKVDSLEHQFPGAEGMLAVYRPIDPAAGTADDPKRFYYGMDVEQGKYYAWNNKLYLAKADMKPCTWEPGSAGVWQWEEIING